MITYLTVGFLSKVIGLNWMVLYKDKTAEIMATAFLMDGTGQSAGVSNSGKPRR
jgi:hypothetical protein